MEEKAVLRVRDRISAALKCLVCAQGGVADGRRPCGLLFAARGRKSSARNTRTVCGGRRGGSAVFDHVGGHPRRRGGLPVPVARGYPRALYRGFARRGGHPLVAVGVKVHPRPPGLRTGPTAFLPLLSTGIAMVFLNGSLSNVLAMYIAESFLAAGTAYFPAPHRAAFGDPPRDRRV